MKEAEYSLRKIMMGRALSITERTHKTCYCSRQGSLLSQNPLALAMGSMSKWEKNDDLWYLTEDMQEGDSPKTYIFYESSNLGELEGSVRFVEHRKGE